MFSKSQIKFIKSLSLKKNRQRQGLFIVEGRKAVSELVDSAMELHSLFTTEDIFSIEEEKKTLISEDELKKVSNLTTPQKVLAVFHIPQASAPGQYGLTIALDEVQDPGNLGTIIRMCDWFGIQDLVCSRGTVDCYNPKVVQATMGSIGRIRIHYLDLPKYLSSQQRPIFGAFLEGENVYSQKLSFEGVLVMGNEANGIRPEVASLITEKLHIPQFGEVQATESLNVATATAIFLSEFSRNRFTEK